MVRQVPNIRHSIFERFPWSRGAYAGEPGRRNVSKVSPADIPSDGTPLGFAPDSTAFTDDTAAGRALATIAARLVDHPSATAEVLGTVAHHGHDEGDAGLSRARAERVAEMLTELGVERRRVSVRGAGWGPFPERDAAPDPAYDRLNRRVVVRVRPA